MNVMHLTWGETPRTYGVFGSQVIAQFVATRRVMPKSKFIFVSALPILHSGLTREKFRYFKECQKVQVALGDIPFKLLPIYAPQHLVNSSASSFNLFHGAAHWHLYRIIKSFKPDVIHCRSYHAAWAALSVRKRNSMEYSIVFDGRGLFPEEVALKRTYADDNTSYRFLKRIEHELLTECDISIAVSDPMKRHYLSLGANKCKTIYLSADSEGLNPLKIKQRANDTVNFCYVGALSEDTWHKTTELKRLFLRLHELIPNANLTIVTTSDHGAVRKYFSEFSEGVVRITESRTLQQLKDHLQQADFGLMSYFEPKTQREIKLADMVLAVKTAEYLCNGLPIIVNKYCGGAAAIIGNHDLGVVYDPSDLKSIRLEDILSHIPDIWRRKLIASKASQLFDYTKHAHDYSDIYTDLHKKTGRIQK
jgi:glycosyltransferase involved in cell wall biosynthesis